MMVRRRRTWRLGRRRCRRALRVAGRSSRTRCTAPLTVRTARGPTNVFGVHLPPSRRSVGHGTPDDPATRAACVLRHGGAPGGRRPSAGRRRRGCRSGSWPARRGRGAPAPGAGPPRLRAGGWPRCGAARAARGPARPAGATSSSWTADRICRGSARRPRRPRSRAGPLPAATTWGRPSVSQASTASRAGAPKGTVRSLPPLPITRTTPPARSRSSMSRAVSSPTRIPLAYNSSKAARSRRCIGSWSSLATAARSMSAAASAWRSTSGRCPARLGAASRKRRVLRDPTGPGRPAEERAGRCRPPRDRGAGRS